MATQSPVIIDLSGPLEEAEITHIFNQDCEVEVSYKGNPATLMEFFWLHQGGGEVTWKLHFRVPSLGLEDRLEGYFVMKAFTRFDRILVENDRNEKAASDHFRSLV